MIDMTINVVLTFTLLVGLFFVLREMRREMLQWRQDQEDWFQ